MLAINLAKITFGVEFKIKLCYEVIYARCDNNCFCFPLIAKVDFILILIS